jgi:hypothetical protein
MCGDQSASAFREYASDRTIAKGRAKLHHSTLCHPSEHIPQRILIDVSDA